MKPFILITGIGGVKRERVQKRSSITNERRCRLCQRIRVFVHLFLCHFRDWRGYTINRQLVLKQQSMKEAVNTVSFLCLYKRRKKGTFSTEYPMANDYKMYLSHQKIDRSPLLSDLYV